MHRIPIEPELDLHPIPPRDVAEVVREYLGEALEHGFPEVRLIHGKGTGALRQTVQAVLEKDPRVAEWHPAGANWGATIVRLKPASG